MQLFKADNTYISIKAADGEFLDLSLKIVFKKILFKKSLDFLKKTKSKMKLNSEHLFELAALEMNAIWRMQYFF